MDEGFLDDTCATCGHESGSHYAGHGRCYGCPAHRRCAKFLQKNSSTELLEAIRKACEESA